MSFERWLAVVGLILLGLIFEFVEVFIPSFGLITIFGIISLLSAAYIVWQSYGAISAGIITLIICGALVIIDLIFAFKLLPRSPMILRTRQHATQLNHEHLQLIGKEGVAHTVLRPAGKMRIGDKVFDAEAEDGFIEGGAAVRVVAARPGRILVRRI